MRSEKQTKKKRLDDNKNETELKSNLYSKGTPPRSQKMQSKMKSTKDNGKSYLEFDDIEENDELQNEEKEPVKPFKRKLSRKTKGLNMTSKIRKTFTMCCTTGRDSSIETVIDDVEKTVPEKYTASLDSTNALPPKNVKCERRSTTFTNNNEMISGITEDDHSTCCGIGPEVEDRRDKYCEELPQKSCEMMISNYASYEDLSICSRVPTNVLQIYANGALSSFLEKIDMRVSMKEDLISSTNERNQIEESALSSDSFSSLSSGEIGYLLNEKDSESSIMKTVWRKLKNSSDFDLNLCPDTNTYLEALDEDIENRFDNIYTDINVSFNYHLSNEQSIIDTYYENQPFTPCSVDTLRRLTLQIKENLSSYHSDVVYKLPNADDHGLVNLQHNLQQSTSIKKISHAGNNISLQKEQQTAFFETNSNILPASCNENESAEPENLENTPAVEKDSSMNNSFSNQSSNSEEGHSNEMLYLVYTMLKYGKIKFERLPHDFPCADNESADVKNVEFLWSHTTLTHEEAREFLEEINKLINSKAIEFEFSESHESSCKITISSYDGKKLKLSQVGVDVVTLKEETTALKKDEVTDTDVERSVFTERSCMLPYSAFIEDLFDASEECMKKLTDYFSMIRDRRFQVVLEDILKVGEGEIHSVSEYLAVLSKGEYIPVYDGIVDDTDNSGSRYRNYIYIIQGDNFRKAVDLALRASSGDRYSLSDYIQMIQDKNIYDLLGVMLQASKLPDHYVKAILQGRISPEADDYSDNYVDKLTSSRLSAYVARRLCAIRKNITLTQNKQSHFADGTPDMSTPSSRESDTTIKVMDVSESGFMTACERSNAIETVKIHKNTSQDSFISITDDAYSNVENIQSPHPSRKKRQNNSNTDWTVSSPIVRPNTPSKPRPTGNMANPVKNRQIKSIYKPSNKRPSGVAVTKSAWLPENHETSGEAEVKSSKAQHDLDHTDDKGSADIRKSTSHQNRLIKHARRQTRSITKQKYEPVLVTVEQDSVLPMGKGTKPKQNVHITSENADVTADVPKAEETPPVYIVTETKVDYGRCVVEPGYGEKPDRKKLRAGKREKVKTKGQANKHLMVKNEKRDFDALMDEYISSIKDDEDVNDSVENAVEKEREEGAMAPSPVVMNAVNQPHILDDREFHLVPDEIKRVDDPFLKDVEELYKVSTPNSSKKDKRKLRAERKKENRSRKSTQTVLKLS